MQISPASRNEAPKPTIVWSVTFSSIENVASRKGPSEISDAANRCARLR